MSLRAVLMGACVLWAWGSVAAASTPRLEQALRAVEAEGFKGVVLVGDSQRLLWRGTAGAGAPSKQALWPWASVTKQITGLLIMQEVERGRLSLDDTIAKLLPTFTGPSASTVTVRQLLQHTSGLPDPQLSPADDAGVPAFYRAPSADAVTTGFCAGAPLAEPGAGFRYNNCDYLVLGAILERVTGKAYATLIDERIARPLKLKSVGVFAFGDGKQARAVQPREGGRPVSVGDFSTYGASAAVYGSAADLLALDRAILSGRLLGAEATRTAWTGEPKLGYAALGVWSYSAPLKGCAKPVRLIERRGHLGVQVRNVLAPDLGRAVVAFTDDAVFEFGEVWQGRGATYALLSAAFCEGGASEPAAR
jgi:CubicO group peptidase (beta-lactamase class C family)